MKHFLTSALGVVGGAIAAAFGGWGPDQTPALWTAVAEPGTIPEWVQPTGATDAYNKGDQVRHADKIWTSDVDANVWEPGVYGWTESVAR